MPDIKELGIEKEYISKKKVLEIYEETRNKPQDAFVEAIVETKGDCVIVPGVERTGVWVRGTHHGLGVYNYDCSECGDFIITSMKPYNYCPECGAHMIGVREKKDTKQ